jgi:hypothetical protein
MCRPPASGFAVCSAGCRPADAGERRPDCAVRSGPGAEAFSRITIRSGDSDRLSALVTFSAEPIRQPVAFGGPRVMNSRTEIQQANVVCATTMV